MKKYTMETQLQPKIHEGRMAYYWKIDIHTEDGTFCIADGWRETVLWASSDAYDKAKQLKLV